MVINKAIDLFRSLFIPINHIFHYLVYLILKNFLCKDIVILQYRFLEIIRHHSWKLFIKFNKSHLLLRFSYWTVDINKTISTCLFTWVSKAFFKYFIFCFYCHFIVIKSIPDLSLSIENKWVIMTNITISIMDKNSMQLIGVLFHNWISSSNFLFNS